MTRLTKEREAEIRRDVEAGRWGAERPRTRPEMVRVWFGKDDTANGLEYSEWFEPALNPERIVQLVRRAWMAADLLAELDATRDELREKDERISRQESSIAELREEADRYDASANGCADDLHRCQREKRDAVERTEAAEAQLAALREAMEAAGVSRGLLRCSPTTVARLAACEAAEAALADSAAAAEAYKRRVQAAVLRRVLEHVAAEMDASTVAGGTVPRDLQSVYGWLRAEAERVEGGGT